MKIKLTFYYFQLLWYKNNSNTLFIAYKKIKSMSIAQGIGRSNWEYTVEAPYSTNEVV